AGRGGRRIHAWGSRSIAAGDGRLAPVGLDRAISVEAARRHDAPRAERGICPASVRANSWLWRIRLSGVALGQLRVAGVCVGLAEALLSRGVRGRAAHQPADGL